MNAAFLHMVVLVPHDRCNIFQCAEKNYPNYGKGVGVNADEVGNRTTNWKSFHPQNPFRALVNLTMLWKYPQLKVIIFDCGGEGPQYYCLSRNHNRYEQISLASISATPEQHFPQDQGTWFILCTPILNEFLRFDFN